jgi:hypothetical protein
MTSKELLNVEEAGGSDCLQSLAMEYAELLRLRRKVREAEALTATEPGSVKSSRAPKNRMIFGRSH